MNVLVRSRLVGLASSILAACSNATTPDDASVGRDAADADIVTVSMDVARVDATLADGRVDARADSARADSARDVVADSGSPFTTPIRHVLVLVKENHTLDSMFLGFPNATTSRTARLSNGTTHTRQRAPSGDFPSDIPHSHAAATLAYHGGALDRFDQVPTVAANRLLPFVYFTEAQIPGYWQLARNYVLADHFFSQMLGPSFPGHFALWTAQTLPVDNSDCDDVIVTRDAGADADAAAPTVCDEGRGCFARWGARAPRSTISTFERGTCAIQADQRPCFDVPSVIDELPAGLTWHAYAKDTGSTHVSPPIAFIRSATRDPVEYDRHVSGQDQLLNDIRAGRLANVTFAHILGAVGEHPPADICDGDNYTIRVVNAVMNGPHWRDTAILITYDDWGGFFDSVPPPQPAPTCANGDHVTLGFRVPLIVVSPFARRSRDPQNPYVFHGMSEHASVPKLIAQLFGMRFMSARDANARDGRAGSLLGIFDFNNPDYTPLTMPEHACPLP